MPHKPVLFDAKALYRPPEWLLLVTPELAVEQRERPGPWVRWWQWALLGWEWRRRAP